MDRNEAGLRRPRTDDRPLWDIVSGLLECPTLLVAHDLKLFPLLARGPRTTAEVAAGLGIAPRPSETLLTMCAAMGLIRERDGRYTLTELAEDYLLDDSPTAFGGYLDLLKASASVYSYAGVKRAVLSDAPRRTRAGTGSSRTRSRRLWPATSPAPCTAPPWLRRWPGRMPSISRGPSAHLHRRTTAACG